MGKPQTEPWPFVKAGVAGVVLRGGQILLVRRKYGGNKGKWCIPCGNIEMGEDVRAAVRREIREETGLEVEVGQVIDSLSTHHAPGRSVAGIWFWATEVGGQLAAGDDAAEARFFPLEAPPEAMAFAADMQIIERLKHSGA